MAIKLIANYSKKLGLPKFSSHQFEVSIETEIANPSEVQAVSANIYNTLQAAVDSQIQQVGFVPDEGYGQESVASATPPASQRSAPANGYANSGRQQGYANQQQEEEWQCSEKQKGMMLGQAKKCGLSRDDLDQLARERFNKHAAQLNRMEASGMIQELMERSGEAQERPANRGGYNNRRQPSAAYNRNSNRYGA